MPEFYIIIARKIFSRFFFGGGDVLPDPPVSYAYVPSGPNSSLRPWVANAIGP